MDFTMIETGWLSILPPIIAIVLALLTKEVYSSLFIGIGSGMLIYAFFSGGSIVSAAAMTFDMMSAKISDNSYMIIFLALLWAVHWILRFVKAHRDAAAEDEVGVARVNDCAVESLHYRCHHHCAVD